MSPCGLAPGLRQQVEGFSLCLSLIEHFWVRSGTQHMLKNSFSPTLTIQTREISVLWVISKTFHAISMRTKKNVFSILNVNFEARTLKILGIIRICNIGIVFLQLRGQISCFKTLLEDASGGSEVKNPPMRETRVQSLGQEDLTCCGATKSVCHNY